MFFKLVRISALLLLAAVSVAQSIPQFSVLQFKDGKITGPGFAFTVASNLPVEVAANLESLHGFYIALPPRESAPEDPALKRSSENPISYRYIAFDTKWDTGDLPSLDAAVASITAKVLDNIPDELVGSGHLTLDASLPARLGTLPARRLVIKYRNAQRQPAIRQVIVAYRTRKDASAMIYTLVLNTTEADFGEDMAVLGKLMAGFKVTQQ